MLHHGDQLEISKEALNAVQHCRSFLDSVLAGEDVQIYGINTGFGSLCNITISKKELGKLQVNLVRSHACGVGEKIGVEMVKAILLLKIIGLSKGYSGVSLETINRLVYFYNKGIYPVIYEMGSLGASGDLAPLAHLSLPLIGEGEVWFQGEVVSTDQVLKNNGLSGITLQSKEGLALLNGTQFSTAHLLQSLISAEKILNVASLTAAFSLEAFNCRLSPFNQLLHNLRPHAGQISVAGEILEYLHGSNIGSRKKTSVQDPYSFRCIPQVHGASYDAFTHAVQVLETEINSVTDNPTVFPDDNDVLSGGNFHAQPIALVLDYLSIAIAEIGNIAERRIYQLINGERSLPDFLSNNPGLESGLMIAQYTAASLVSQNKQYAVPASTDSIVSSAGQEDHVSMAANAGLKCLKICENVKWILAIECICAHQGVEMQKDVRLSEQMRKEHLRFRSIVPHLDQDRYLNNDILLAKDYLFNR